MSPALPSPDRVKSAQAFYAEHRQDLERFRGGMPVGFFAAIAQAETDGKMEWGDKSIGEYGYFQVTSDFPVQVGVNPEVRMHPHGNIFLAGLEYQIRAVRTLLDFPQLVRAGTADQWKLARLAFAIGEGGLKAVIRAAHLTTGKPLYSQLIAWVSGGNAFAISPMSAHTVAARILDVETQWAVGLAVNPSGPSTPRNLPAPAGIRYRMPKDIAAYFRKQSEPTILAMAAIALVLLA